MKEAESIKKARVTLLKDMASLINSLSSNASNSIDAKKLYHSIVVIDRILKIYRYILRDRTFEYFDENMRFIDVREEQ